MLIRCYVSLVLPTCLYLLVIFSGHTLSWSVMLKLAHSMMKGLSYLHDELNLPNGSRSLAHRDIKSKNVLIKDDMTAAIADFGLAEYFKDGRVDGTHAQVDERFVLTLNFIHFDFIF